MRQYKFPFLLISILMIVAFVHPKEFVNSQDVASGRSFAGELVLLPTDKIVTNNGGASDNFGYSVDMDGDTLVGGAAFAEVDGIPERGAAYIMVDSAGEWSQQAKLVAEDGAYTDWFGISVAVWGDTAVVGSPRAPVNMGMGAAYIFVRTGNSWTQQAKLIANDNGAGNWFGVSVAIHEDTVLIGTLEGPLGAGTAYVFTRSGNNWSKQAKLTADDGHLNALFGAAVALDSDTAIIGAPGNDVNGHDQQGSAYVFTRSGNTWTQQAKLIPDSGGADDWFGRAVDIEGNTIVIGQPRTFFSDNGIGVIHTFTGSGSNWAHQAELTAMNPRPGDGFGYDVSISEDTIVVGTNHGTRLAGEKFAYAFTQSGNNWTQYAKLSGNAGENVHEDFGISVVNNGNLLIIGAPLANIGQNENQGAVYVYSPSFIYLPIIMQP